MKIDITENLFLNDIIWETPDEINDYYRKNIEKIFGKHKIYLEKFLYIKYKKKYHLKHGGIWINKVTSSTNTHDTYHFDDSDLSIVTYLNDDFMGGEFEYINKNGSNIKINPTKGQSLIMDGKILHRVLPVVSGERYSLISFFDSQKKDFKTLL